jgi:hypothetical protein
MAHLPRGSILQRNRGREAEKFEDEKWLGNRRMAALELYIPTTKQK